MNGNVPKRSKSLWITAILILFSWAVLYAQETQRTVSGTVTDADNNEPLPGVNVLVKGTTTGTITDIDGNYQLQVGDAATLVFSSVGYMSEEVSISGQSTINLSMTPDIQSLSEVVVVGYGEKKKSHSIGAVASVDGAEIDKIPTATADQALLGKLAGVNIKTNSGNSGEPARIQIRGLSSISASNSPLIVVDGYPIQGDLSSINMQDVESINVLKDAASASIYGSRAGSGVILVTTKKGQAGKVVMEYNFYGGIKNGIRDNLSKNPLSDNLDKFPSLAQWKAYVTAQGGSDFDEINLAESFGTHTDWYDEVYKTGSIMNHQLSARGGTENVKYFFSGNYVDDKGIVLTNEYSKYSFRANVDVKANDWLEFGLNLNPTYSTRRDPAVENHSLFRTAPWVPLRHNAATAAITGKEIGSFANENDFDIGRNPDYTGIRLRVQSDYNPTVLLNDHYLTKNRLEGFANTYLKFKIAESLSFKTSFGGYLNQLEDQRFQASTTSRTGIESTFAHYQTAKVADWLNENVLSFNKSIGSHTLNAIAGLSTQVTNITLSGVEARYFVIDYIQTVNGGQLSGGLGSTRSKSALNSMFFRLDYDMSDKYLVSISSRWDGSSRFGANNQYGYFPSASVGWRISEEGFLSNSSFIDNLKLRASIGTTGNNTIGDFSHIGLLGINNSILGGNIATGFAPSNISNPNLGWEKTRELNFGLDLGVIDSRVQLQFDFFKTSTEDLLLEVPLSMVTGYEFFLDNQGKVENTGYELNLTTINTTGALSWSSNINLSHYQNELVDFGGTERLINVPDPKRPNEFLAEVGSPLVQYYGYVSDGEIPYSAHNTTWPVNGSTDFVFAKDLNDDGVIDENDKTVLGSPYPDLTWGFTNTLQYRGLDLSVTLQGSHGAEIFNIDSYYENSQYVNEDISGFELTDADKSRLVVRSQSDFNVMDASYFSVRNLTLGYNLPLSFSERLGLSDLRVYFTGTNLLFITADDYTGFNPEATTEATTFSGTFTNNPLVTGYQRGAHPVQRALAIGINVKF
ncbi:TonB-linked SusC/RagA family outer membrane protein [Catalinimonas alkaloidigena]|uniref:SusC/RagA family TonB-linked outer membrane protein n=1 Tax=Catalinimonas alkaloidigena TaxID=1075417 RepID=UPI002405E864|nr:TonB-dependent receptor [Catalinimonas alkaloidigena]MDF9799284.1 TonB-linked SusC/RagA family outer membrane protein [Catalinimonas alkaloidigena]